MKKSKLLSSLIFVIVYAMLPFADVWAQTVQGTVTTTEGEALPGVNVVVVGENAGTSTDTDGEYSLNVPSLQNNEIRFSFIGYENKVIQINGRTTVDVTMQSQAQQLGELVVTGYGTEKKANLTTSVSTVNASELNVATVNSFSEALSGQAPGVRVKQTSGDPGGGISIQVRGVGSINANNDPLYVVDGVALSSTESRGGSATDSPINPLASLNSADIQSIDILKGASATSIYGSRGANGVVLITTKSGTAGQSRIDVGMDLGWQSVAKTLPLMSKEDYVQQQIDQADILWESSKQGRSRNDPYSVRDEQYIPYQEFQNPSQYGYYDWQKALYSDAAPKQKYNISASGGSENVQYYLSGIHQNTDGIVVNSNFKNYGFRAKINGDINDHVRAGINISPSYSTRNIAHQAGIAYYGGSASIVLGQNPFYPIYNEDGSYSYSFAFTNPDGTKSNRGYSNPIASNNGIDRSIDHFSTLGDVYVEVDFTDNLSLKSSLSGDFNFYNSNNFKPSSVAFGRIPPTPADGSSSSNRDIRWDNRNLLTYQDQFAGKHDVEVLLGLEEQKTTYLNSNLQATDFPNDRVPTLNSGTINGGSSNRSAWTLLSYFGRVKYNFDEKYLVQATLRRDGSSRFGADNKWGYFPSASVGWRIDQEDFMDNLEAISSLKIRVGYGITGNNGIGNYAPIGRVSQTTLPLGVNADLVNGLYQNSISNPALSWEKQRALDVGLNLGLYKGRINFSADLYNRINDDLLLNVNLPYATGYSSTTRNLGKVRNRGIELALNTVNIQSKDFNWSTRFNFAINRNEVMDLNGQELLTQDFNFYNPEIFLTREGLPIGSFYGYVYEGVYTDKEDFLNHAHFNDVYTDIAQRDGNGDIVTQDGVPVVAEDSVFTRHLGGAKFKDLNGDGIISPQDDKKPIGDNYPDFTYGISSSLSYKNWNFSFQLQGEQGLDVMNLTKMTLFRRNAEYFTDYWRSPENPGDGQTFAPTGGLGHNREPSSYFLEDASFLRINSVNLGYQVPQKFLGGGGVFRELRVYVNVRNLYTFTSYQGYNPQVRSGRSYQNNDTVTPGLDFGSYPLPRTFSIGINVGL